MKRTPKNRKQYQTKFLENIVSNKMIWNQCLIPGFFLSGFFFIFLPQIGFSSEIDLRKNLSIERGQNSLSGLFFRRETFGLDRLHVPQSQNRIRTWIHGFGNWSNVGVSTQLSDLEYTSYGVTVGIDQQIGRNFLFGISLGGNECSIKTKSGRYHWSSDISAAHTSAYFRMALQNLFFDLEGGLGYNDQSLPAQTALQWNVNGEAGTWWTQGLGKVEPYLGFRHVSLEIDPDTESKTTLLVGVRYSWKTTGKYSITSPRLYTGVLQELGDRHLMNIATFTDTPTVFAIPGYEMKRTRFFAGGGFTSSMGTSLDIYLRYTAELASDYTSHTLLLGMNWNY